MSKQPKSMIGEKIIGYICAEKEKTINGTNRAYVYINACDSIALPLAEDRTQAPIIYEVEGISTVKKENMDEHGYYERAYYTCDNIRVIKELTPDQLIEKAEVFSSSAYRLIAFYPLTELQALKLAKIYVSNYYILKALAQKYPQNAEIGELFKISQIEKDKNEKAQIKHENFQKRI